MSKFSTRKNRTRKGGVKDQLNKLFGVLKEEKKDELQDIKKAKTEVENAKLQISRLSNQYGRVHRTLPKHEIRKAYDSLGRAEKSLKQAYNRQSEGVEMKDMKSLSGGKTKKTRRRRRN
jgi:hypothetical protein